MLRCLDIDQILSEEDRVPCIFKYDVEQLGHLDPTVFSEHLPSGSKVELPIWLASALHKGGMADMEIPKHYDRKMRDEILAGAASINLKEFSYYFYEVGAKLAKELNNKDLKTILAIAFSGDRFRNLLTHSLSSLNDDVSQYVHNLTAAELHILNEGSQNTVDIGQWKLNQVSILRRSSMLRNQNNNSSGHSEQRVGSKRKSF